MMRKTLLIICLSALCLSSCGLLKRAGEKTLAKNTEVSDYLSAEFYISEGIKASSLFNQVDKAQQLFYQAIKSDSTFAPSYYYAAENLYESNPTYALTLSQRANSLDTINLWYKEQLGKLLIINEKYSDALTFYKDFIKLNPSEPNNYRLLAAIYQQEKQPLEAIKVLDEAETKFGRIEELSDFKRQLLIQVNQIDKAIDQSVTLVEEYPFNTNNLLMLAELYAATEQQNLALEYYNKALELNPTHAATLSSLSRFYQLIGDVTNYFKTLQLLFINPDIGVEYKIYVCEELTQRKDFYKQNFLIISSLMDSIIASYPDNYTVIELYAKHLLAQGKFEQTLEFYKKNLDNPETRFSIANNIISLESYLNRADSMAKYSKIALENSPKNIETYINLGSSLSYIKKTQEALEIFKQGLQYAKTDSLKSVIYGMMGDAAYFNNEGKQSEVYYKKSLKLDPENAMILNNYSYFLVSERDNVKGYKKALEMAVRANDLVKNSPTFLDTYAWAHYQLGNYNEAKKIMQKALSLDNNRNVELLLHYGDILYALEDYFMATLYWKRALDKGADKEEVQKRLDKIK